MVNEGDVFYDPYGLYYTVAEVKGEDCICYAFIEGAKVVKEFKTEDIRRWRLDVNTIQWIRKNLAEYAPIGSEGVSLENILPPGEYTITISRYQTQQVKVIVNGFITLDKLVSQEEDAAPTHDDSFDPETTEYEVISILDPNGSYILDPSGSYL